MFRVNDDGDSVCFALLAKFETVETEVSLSDPKRFCSMKEELKSIDKNNIGELVDLPGGKKPIILRWVYKVKENLKGKTIKNKAWLVTKGFL